MDVSAYEYNGADLNLTGGAYPEQVHAIRVTADYFRLFGAPLIQGRGFTREEDRPNGARAVFELRALATPFRGRSATVGQIISLSGTPYVVAGVVGRSFNTELDATPDVWLPFQIDPTTTDHAQYLSVIGRFKPAYRSDGGRHYNSHRTNFAADSPT